MPSKEKRDCANCGSAFMAGPTEHYCFPCEILIRAVEPPEILRDMRAIYSGGPGTSISQAAMKKLLDTDIIKFMDRLTKLEDQYRAAAIKWEQTRKMKDGAVKWDGEGVCPGCGRGTLAEVVKDASTGALIGKVEQWVRKRGEVA